LIAEVYDILRTLAGMDNLEMSEAFAEWNEGELESFLIEITASILGHKDDLTPNGFLIDKILDKTGMKGTGRWTIQEAAERSVAAPTMASALDVRYLSARKDERIQASKVLKGPNEVPIVHKQQILNDCKDALYCAKVCSYAQGLCIIKSASEQMGWGVDLSECARIWKGGCIIRAGFLERLQTAYVNDPNLCNLLMDPMFVEAVNNRQNAWRRIVSLCVASGLACPALSASLAYYDTYRRENLPANLTQAQRDYFGGHTYERLDRPGTFHAHWTAAHHDLGDIASRTAGNL